MRHLDDDERRRRLVRRHGLTRDRPLSDVESVVRAVVVLHATEPATVYLSIVARAPRLRVADIETALHDERSVVKQLAMRRTLFVFPRDLLPAAWGSASARVAASLEARLVKEVEGAELAEDGAAWLAAAKAAVLEQLADGSEASAQVLRQELPELTGRLGLALGTPREVSVSIAPRVLTQLGLEARLTRGRNGGHWRTSRPQWTLMSTWLGEHPPALASREGYAELVRRWLAAFGPGTEADLVWWLGATKGAVRAALVDVEAVEVALDRGETGWLLPGDTDPEAPQAADDGRSVALLPVLDPTTMGWKGREFYLGGHGPLLFDRNGNAGTTAWVDGRVVGCWVQDDAGRVVVRLLEEVSAAARQDLDAEADRLTTWLDGLRIGTVYPSPAMRADA